MSYSDFLAAKQARAPRVGVDVDTADLHPSLFDWQAEIVRWAADVGRAAIWADTGLGKTRMQLEWARVCAGEGFALIVAPLAVCAQTVREAAVIGIDATYVRGDAEVSGPGIYVTNYEMVTRFDPARLAAVVLDEASILKQSNGATRTMLIEHFEMVPRRLACTATPAPNDPEELTNQAAFLGTMTRANMLAAYFVHDQDGWRPKGHARGPMFQWMATWALAIRRPSDLGYPDDDYELPGLEILPHLLPVDLDVEGQLFATELGGVGGRAQIRKATLVARCERVVEIVNASHELAAIGDKLATWDGSPSTPKTDAGSTSRTRPSGSAERPKDETQKRTASTCATTTPPTATPSSSTSATPPSAETLAAESATPATPSSVPSASDSASCATQKQSATDGSARPSASPQPSTTNSSNCRAEDAPSAALKLATEPAADSPSTTATTPDASAGSCAAIATLASESSETTHYYSHAPSNTSAALEPWIVWCGLNDEQDALARAFGDRAFSIFGSQTPEQKVDLLDRWLAGERPILITKTSIAGMGINAQHCARMAFVGLSDSYEAYYQSIRRCYRYGQHRVVHAHVVLSEIEAQIATNIARKERESTSVIAELVIAMRAHHQTERQTA